MRKVREERKWDRRGLSAVPRLQNQVLAVRIGGEQESRELTQLDRSTDGG